MIRKVIDEERGLISDTEVRKIYAAALEEEMEEHPEAIENDKPFTSYGKKEDY